MQPTTPQNIASTDFQAGTLLLVDKPKDWTSFDVVNKIRFALKKKLSIKKIKVGHAGTLDPMATGLLLICTGKMTKQIDTLQALEKRYEGTMTLGATTPSYDAETPLENITTTAHLSQEEIREKSQAFLGEIAQVPPMYSAIKVDGQPLYKRARKGEHLELKSRKVTIFDLDIEDITLPEVFFSVRCSKGTYIRSLAHDWGHALGVGAYLSALRRTAIGDYDVKNAWTVQALVSAINAD